MFPCVALDILELSDPTSASSVTGLKAGTTTAQQPRISDPPDYTPYILGLQA